MALSLSQRLGLTRWSAGTDPFSRSQLDTDHARLDDLAAMDVQVNALTDRPAPAIRGRYCWVVNDRTLWRDTGDTWHQISESDAGGAPLIRRAVTADKPAGDAPSTYPLGLSSLTTAAQGAWPATNLAVITQRPTTGRATQWVTQQTTGRMWVRSQNTTDAWGRFSEAMEALRFTSTTRPTTDLYDGLRGNETDTGATVVWSAARNRWEYTQTLRFLSTARPVAGLYDGLIGFETDTGTTVIWQAAGNRWVPASQTFNFSEVPRFATQAARNTAATAFVAAGGALADGMLSWTDDSGLWLRRGGAWVIIDPKTALVMRAQRTINTDNFGSGSWQSHGSDVNWSEVDPWGMRGSGARLVAPWPGWYDMKAAVGFQQNATGGRGIQLLPINADGTPNTALGIGEGGGQPVILQLSQASATTSTVVGGSHEFELPAGGIVIVQSYQESGVPLTVTTLRVSAKYLGPGPSFS